MSERERERPTVPNRIIDRLILTENRPHTAHELAVYTNTYFGWTRRAVKKMVEDGELERFAAEHHNIPLYRLP